MKAGGDAARRYFFGDGAQLGFRPANQERSAAGLGEFKR